MSRLDKWFQARRRREIETQPRLRWRHDAEERLQTAGLGRKWRIYRGKARGHWTTGERCVLDADAFIDRFMVREYYGDATDEDLDAGETG